MNKQKRLYELAKAAGLIEFDQLDSGALIPNLTSVAKAMEFARLVLQESQEVELQWAQGLVDINYLAFVNKKTNEYFGLD